LLRRIAASSSWRYVITSPVEPIMMAALSGVVRAKSCGNIVMNLVKGTLT